MVVLFRAHLHGHDQHFSHVGPEVVLWGRVQHNRLRVSWIVFVLLFFFSRLLFCHLLHSDGLSTCMCMLALSCTYAVLDSMPWYVGSTLLYTHTTVLYSHQRIICPQLLLALKLCICNTVSSSLTPPKCPFLLALNCVLCICSYVVYNKFYFVYFLCQGANTDTGTHVIQG